MIRTLCRICCPDYLYARFTAPTHFEANEFVRLSLENSEGALSMSTLRDIRLVYRERLIVYAVGTMICLASTQYWESPIVIAAIPAISMWISMSFVIHVLMSLMSAFRDPITSTLGIPNRGLQVILLVVGFTIIAAATLYGSSDIGTWGCFFLLFALDSRLGERESWRRYRLKQRQEQTMSA